MAKKAAKKVAKKGPSKTAAGGARKKLLEESVSKLLREKIPGYKKGSKFNADPKAVVAKGEGKGIKMLRKSVSQMSDKAVKSAVKHKIAVPFETKTTSSNDGKAYSTFGKGSTTTGKKAKARRKSKKK